jgi:hypothetical protein
MQTVGFDFPYNAGCKVTQTHVVIILLTSKWRVGSEDVGSDVQEIRRERIMSDDVSGDARER